MPAIPEPCGVSLPSFGRDQAFELAIFAATRRAARRLDAIEIAACPGEITLGDVKRAGVPQGRDVIWIGGQRLGVPVPRLVEIAELGVGKSDRACNVWMVVIAERLHRRDAGFIFTGENESARCAKTRLLSRSGRCRLDRGRRSLLHGSRRQRRLRLDGGGGRRRWRRLRSGRWRHGLLRRRCALLFFILASGLWLRRPLLAHGRFFRPGIRIPVAEAADAADRRHALFVSVEAAIVAAVAIGRAPGGFLGGRGRSERQRGKGDQTSENDNSHWPLLRSTSQRSARIAALSTTAATGIAPRRRAAATAPTTTDANTDAKARRRLRLTLRWRRCLLFLFRFFRLHRHRPLTFATLTFNLAGFTTAGVAVEDLAAGADLGRRAISIRIAWHAAETAARAAAWRPRIDDEA